MVFYFFFVFLPSTLLAQSSQPFSNPAGGSWNMVFSDEFSGTTLNTTAWEPSWFGGSGVSNPINSDEDGCYDAAQVSVNGGTLKLAAVTTTKTNCTRRDGSRASYASGLINSRPRSGAGYTFTYGYFEARMYLPGSGGDIWNWPAFWSNGLGPWPETGEIDVMESLSSHLPCWHYHYEDSSGNHQGPGDCADMDGTGWHVYAAHWEPGKITYYYDGVQVGVITQGVVDVEHYLILNNGINDRYGINVPATVEVDYMRVWEKATGPTFTPAPTPTSGPTSTPSRTPTPTMVVSPTPILTGTVVGNFSVIAGSDDAEEVVGTGSVDIASSDLELVHEFDINATQIVGMRFQNITIPKDAVISNAYIQFTVDETNDAAGTLQIYGHNTGNSATFTTSTSAISSRPKTTSAVSWTPASWTAVALAGVAQRTPGIQSVIQEIVTRPDWASGNALSIMINGTGRRVAESYDGLPGSAPRLFVEYTVGSISPSPTSTSLPVPGDTNNDGRVTILDLSTLLANFGGSNKTWSHGDFDGNGLVSLSDLSTLLSNFGK